MLALVVLTVIWFFFFFFFFWGGGGGGGGGEMKCIFERFIRLHPSLQTHIHLIRLLFQKMVYVLSNIFSFFQHVSKPKIPFVLSKFAICKY